MQILLIIENIAHRQRMVRYLGNRPEPLIAKSVTGAFEYIDSLTLDVIISDLVVGSTTAAEIFTRARAVERSTPRCLCLVPDSMTNQLEVNGFREISKVDDIDFMKKSDVEQGLAAYLQRVTQAAGDKPKPSSAPAKAQTPTPSPTKAQTLTTENRAMAASPEQQPAVAGDEGNDFDSSIMRLDKQHKELVKTLSQVQKSFAAVEKQVSAIESRVDRIESLNATMANQEA